MSRETKLGIVFIGILLFVFGALLVKKLTRPTNRGLDASIKPTEVAGDSIAATRQPLASPPTLVTPKSDGGKSSAVVGGGNGAGSNGSPGASSTSWSGSSSPSAPAVIAAPIPIADLGDRYDDRSTSAAKNNGSADSSLSAGPGQAYHSGYGSASDAASSTTSSSRTTVLPSEPNTDPFQIRQSSELKSASTTSAAPQNDWSKPAAMSGAGSTTASDLSGTKPAENVSSRYQGTTQVDPFHKSPQERQPYTAQVAAGTISEPVRSGGWDRPAAASSAINPMSRYGNSTVAPPVAVASELTGAAAVPNIARDGEQYAVQPNDSYWTISEKAYGTGAFFKALHEYNRKKHKDADEMHVGQTLLVPDENVLRRAYPDLCPKPRRNVASVQQRMVSASSRLRGPGRVYTVVDGDTLFEIARHELGKPSRWGEIYELNRDVLGDDFDYLRAGTELILPSSNESKPRNETAVRPPDAIYPR